MIPRIKPTKNQEKRLLDALYVLLFTSILWLDYQIPLGVATGILYVPILMMTVKHFGYLRVVDYAIIATLFIILGYFFSPPLGDLSQVLLNRAFSIIIVWAVAVLLVKYLTEKKEKDFQQKKHSHVANIISSINAGVAIINQDGVITETNSNWDKMQVENQFDLIGKPIDTNIFKLKKDVSNNVIKDSYHTIKKVNSILAGLKQEVITEINTRSGKWFRVHISPLVDESGVVICCFEISKEKELLRDKLVSRCHLLSTQLNPHFIFNALNSVQYYIMHSQMENAVKHLSSFAQLMRSTLENSFHTLIPIEKEKAYLERFIELEKFRSGSSIDYKIEMTGEKHQDVLIPPMLLQPFIENAIIHGLSADIEDKKLRVCIDVKKTHISCTVEDNGKGRCTALPTEKVSKEKISRGMQLINDKLLVLNELYGGGFHLDIIDKKNPDGSPCGTKVIVKIPKVSNTYQTIMSEA